jgi:hypothetical protein
LKLKTESEAVMPSPRALLGVAPAFVVVAGSFVLSRACLREAGNSGNAESIPVRSEIVARPSAEDEERLHRVALKQEAVEDLLTGQLTLAETVERFEMLSTSAEAQANLQTSGHRDPDGDPAVSQVLAFARVRTAQDPHRFGAALARLEAQARSPAGPMRAAN